jgi:IclR family pca regulon transcriptional regulator
VNVRKRAQRKPRSGDTRDPLFNQSVEKALAILEVFGGIGVPIGRRLPMYCTASGRAYLSALPPAEAQKIVRRSPIQQFTPLTLTDPVQILERIELAREAGYAWSDQECYRGDLTIAAVVLGDEGRPVAAVNISAPTSRWTLEDLRSKLSSVLLETTRAASGGIALRLRG